MKKIMKEQLNDRTLNLELVLEYISCTAHNDGHNN